MNSLPRDELHALIDADDGEHVSIYMPTVRAGRETRENPIRFENLVGQALDRLVARGMRKPDAERFLEPTQELLADDYFWHHQSVGLAVFLARGTFRYYRLPLGFSQFVTVGGRFHVKPLLSLFCDDGRFYVLALSQDEVRLLHGTRHAVDAVSLSHVPESLAEALKWDDPERQLQLHTSIIGAVGAGSVRATAGGPPAVFHGHGLDKADVHKEHIQRYLHRLDEGLSEILAGERAPMVLAAVDYMHALFREANSYNNLLEEGILGNPENVSDEELHQQAWSIVAPVFAAQREEAAETYHQLAGSGSPRALASVDETVRAAHFGRISSLFVALEEHVWGTYDPQTDQVERHEEPQPGEQDLLDYAAVQTLLNDGAVFAVELDAVPGDAPVAAILRY